MNGLRHYWTASEPEVDQHARVLGTALGYAAGVTGAVAFALLAFVRLEHGAYPTPETTYAAVSYFTGNAAAASDFYEITGSALLFLSVVHATRNRKIAYLWLVAGGSQALGIGTLPLYRASIAHYRIENIVDAVTFGTGAVPVAVPVAVVATLLTVGTARQDGRRVSLSRLRQIVGTKRGKIVSVSEKPKDDRWLILSKLTGYLVSVVSLVLGISRLVSTSEGFVQGVFEAAAFVFLAAFVYNVVSTESQWLLVLLGGLGTSVGVAGLQYGTSVSSPVLSAGVLLFVSGVSSTLHRRRVSQ